MVKQRQKSKKNDVDYRKFDKESDCSDEETELLSINRTPKRDHIPSTEKVIEEGDTLQSLAIKHHCSTEDLKRLNNIHKENEIYARRTIKVPYRPFTMALAEVHENSHSSPEHSIPSTSKAIDIDNLVSDPNTSVNIPNGKVSVVNEIIFNSNIQKSPDKIVSGDIVHDINDEEILLLPQIEVLPDTSVTKLTCNGVDGDISWIALVICIVVIIFAVPLIYVFYIAEHPEKFQHHVS